MQNLTYETSGKTNFASVQKLERMLISSSSLPSEAFDAKDSLAC